ncbi:MAG: GDP-mannose 4,6-dehydratase [Anaerolineae bacterium]|nr:GDP-mannose 4,6-dehydratase [Anaerolineae bacterium]
MQRLLVTGGAGFIGSHLVDALVDAGHEIIVLDDLSVGKRHNFAHHLGNARFQFVEGSVLDARLVGELIAQVDAIYHLAAVVGVKYIVDNPVRGMRVNIRGTENVLEAAQRTGAKVLVASSSEVYGKSTQVPFREEDNALLGATSVPRWSYALSKMLDEHLAFAYTRQTGLPTVAVRYFNAYGPRLDPKGYGSVIARFMTQALCGQPLSVYGDGLQTRSFTCVEDTVRGTIAAMMSDRGVGQAFNIGYPMEVTIVALADLVRDAVGTGVDVTYIPYERAFGTDFEEARRRCPDVSRARALLGFEASVSLSDGLPATVQWFKEHRDELNSA